MAATSGTVRRRRRWPAAYFLLAALLLGSATGCDRHVSWESNSYYVASTDEGRMGRLGCANGGKQGRMTLFFGAPIKRNRRYGASLWAARNQSTYQIADLVQQFIRGYVWCRHSSRYQLFVGIGTSNSTIDDNSYTWVRRHGRAWALMVRSVSRWADRHYPGVVRVYGAWDAEPSWSSRRKATKWLNGYQGVRGHRPLHANMSADGCSPTSSRDAPCNNGWSQRDLWNLAWRRGPSLPVPQIYANSGVNARQWQRISEYGVRQVGRRIHFHGTMTQAGACRQVGGCVGTTNQPHTAHDQLLDALARNRRTRQRQIWSTTDMRWHS